ncbi:MAG: hypothetical protein HND46_23120 [Chloroflexi bacterium]|nr:hypothetical protein [Chloroflexota bacterium]
MEAIPRYTALRGAYGIAALLYKGLSPSVPNFPAIKLTRNSELITRYRAGESVPTLAKEYGISEQRAYQIIAGKRK